ncbi:hypothetical protein Pyn_26625 [Prunus yedoensis var. nudiflora]|uniref:Leucine-rich repeat-containing N-terminal plant-type domain-containing protein n=1 Tax=Prunus yedoensis var. nudiflora TaxID=2094558 RepID=A0A314XLX9_PRUYE|nr:hypothetical protein Pyn_26625 [Prunus yedoensis var. nudiflora]
MNIHACKHTERSSLLSFASAVSAPPSNWTSLDCCRWKGITCNQDGWVTHLLLPSKGLKGVDLSSNHFFGAIPSSFFQQASNLTSFNVSNNTFTGEVFQLQVFRAGHNNLSGLLPEDIYNATKLEEIALPLSSLHGAISDKIVNLTNLAILDLYINQLSGKLPLNLGKLSKLKFVTLDFNNLEGALPPSLMNCTNLVELRLGSNNLEGDISMLDFSRLNQLAKLDLRVNNFTGTFPVSLYSCRSLKAIRLTGNNLVGQIQAEILSLKSLSFLSLGFNQFTNLTGAMKILMSCKSLALMLSGSFKDEGMPTDNDMVDFDGFQNLRVLCLVGNRLTGQLPVWLSKLHNLKILLLSGNEITGPIPSWLGTLPRLFYINLSENRFSGEFPKQLCRLPRLVYEPNITSQVDHISNEFELPFYFSTITRNPNYYLSSKISSYPATIDLSNNNIVGDIPIEVGQLQLLRGLVLHSNNFSGVIPDQISNLKNLEVLNLSMNHLSGIIPSSLASLTFLKEFMSHTIISKDQYQQALSSKASTLLPLRGIQNFVVRPLPNKCGRPNKGIDEDNKKNNKDMDNGLHQLPWFYISSIVLGFIVGFWGWLPSTGVKCLESSQALK